MRNKRRDVEAHHGSSRVTWRSAPVSFSLTLAPFLYSILWSLFGFEPHPTRTRALKITFFLSGPAWACFAWNPLPLSTKQFNRLHRGWQMASPGLLRVKFLFLELTTIQVPTSRGPYQRTPLTWALYCVQLNAGWIIECRLVETCRRVKSDWWTSVNSIRHARTCRGNSRKL